MKTDAAVWDPFEGQIVPPAGREVKPGQSLLPPVFKKLELPVFLISLPGFVLALFSESLRPLGMILATVGIGGGFAIQHFTGSAQDRLFRLQAAARAVGYAFRAKIPGPRMVEIQRKAPEMFKLRVGGSIPLILESEMWGIAEHGSPMWMGVGAHGSAAFFGGPRQNEKAPGSGAQGNVVMMVAAYKLDRDTGARIVLMPENFGAIGPLDRDLKTESVAFNKAFNIRVTGRETGDDLDRMTVEVLQVLTPAFQTTLLDLSEHYAARVIVDGDTVFFGGFRNLQSLEEDVLK